MLSIRKQWTRLLLLTLTVCLFFSHSPASAFNSSTLKLPTQEVRQVRDVIKNYCTQVLESNSFVENGFAYNAKQSAFVHLLCRDFVLDASYFDKDANYFKRTTFKQLWFTDIITEDWYDTDLCDHGGSLNDCDLATNIPDLFNGIMNDYVNMKQPNLYGMNANFKEESEIENQINISSSENFGGLGICDPKTARYPNTCKIMKWYIKNVRNILADVSILSATGILDIASKKKDTVSCAGVTAQTDIFYCGLYGDTATPMISFVNLTYNELFYYRLFMAYYLTMIQQYPSLLDGNSYVVGYDSVSKSFSSQYTWSKDALSLSLRMMRDTYMAFPFHIWFLMYQEDLNWFWKDLSRIAPSLYTLDRKLRNVQKP